MRQFLVDEFRKFKIEVVELIQYVSKFKILTMNIQTYLSIALLVFLGIDTNVFILSLIPGITYTQYDYNMISYVGAILYTLYIFSINYMRLNYYEKDSFNWLNIVIIIFLIVMGWLVQIVFLVLILGLQALLTIYWGMRYYGA